MSQDAALESRRAAPTRFGTAMLRRFGWFYHATGLGWALRRLRMDEFSVERVLRASREGSVVYVLPERSNFAHLALNTALTARRLPLSVWADGAWSFPWQPLWEAWSDVAWRWRAFLQQGFAPDPVKSGWLSQQVAEGHPVTLFLNTQGERPLSFLRPQPRDPLEALIEAVQRGAVVRLLPVLVVWDRAPAREGSAVQAFFQVGRTVAGPLAGFRDAWLRRDSFIQVGEPIDLATVIARFAPDQQVAALRRLLRGALRTEDNLVRGPRLLPFRQMKRMVLDNPGMREFAVREAQASGQRPEAVQKKMDREYDRIAARFRWWMILVLSVVLRPLWTRVFSGVDAPGADMERIRSALRDGTAVLLPSHKSHLDYVLLSWVFFSNDLIVPHVIAGMNLTVWPMGPILRSGGGLFLKRTFAEDRIHPAVFARYLRELVYQGYPLEFYLEGGRTRSGKLLPAKVGVLGMVLDAAELRPKGKEVTLLPIALAYEQVAEEGVYARELGGERKQPESFGQLLRARSVLRRRFGRVYLRVGEPIRCSALVDPAEGQLPWSDRQTAERKAVLHQVGARVMYRIGQNTVLLPTSLVALGLMANDRRGLAEPQLLDRVRRFRALFQRAGVPEAASLEHAEAAYQHALERFQQNRLVELLVYEGERVWAVVPDSRLTLDFYKNQALHPWAQAGLSALALQEGGPADLATLEPRYASLEALFQREFIFNPDLSPPERLAAGVAELVALGAAGWEDGALVQRDPARAAEVLALFASLIEAYLVVLSAIEGRGGLDLKALPRAAQDRGKALLAQGVVTRPESLSLVSLENAVATLRDLGVLKVVEAGRAEVQEASRASWVQRLAGLLG